MLHYTVSLLASRPGEPNEIRLLTINDMEECRTLRTKEGEPASNVPDALKWFNKSFQIASMNFQKEMYKPGYLYIKLYVSDPKRENLFSPTHINNAFMERTVQLTISNDAGRQIAVAQDYYIFEVYPQKVTADSSGLYIEIKAYSPDKYLSINTHCAAFLGKKPSELLHTSVQGFKALYSAESQKFNISTQGLRFLAYDKNQDTQNEYILPYTVQYNESNLDFLVRTAHKYGEFLYYEKGLLNWGLVDSPPIKIDKYASLSYGCIVADNGYNTVYNNYLTGVSTYNSDQPADQASIPVGTANSEMVTEEYLSPLTSVIQVKQDNRKMLQKVTYVTPDSYIAKSTNLKYISTALLAEGLLHKGATVGMFYAINSISKEYNAKRLNKKLTDRIKKSSGDELKEGVLYNDGKELINNSLCSKAMQRTKLADQQKITIDLDSNIYHELALGSAIRVENADYIVIQIKGAENNTTGNSTMGKESNRTKIMLKLQLVAIPKVLFPEKEKESYPPSIDISPIRKSAPQTAIVVDNMDPLRLNRVRIRYPWQPQTAELSKNKLDEAALLNASPWIRISSPVASNGSGFNFLPEVGDQVIVNYENGNVEHPYLEGSFYTKKRTPSRSAFGSELKSISSSNGHSISFFDNPVSDSFYTSMQPALDLLSKVIPDMPTNTLPPELSGHIEMTDVYGMYSLKLSTEKRKISIESPFGDVSVSAFTGISIEAPNGNVSIKGKNVSIEAGNNLSILSGTNISHNDNAWWKQLIIAGLKVAVPFTLNLGLIRTVIESFFRPIGGTMLIKSNRYLCLESGKGNTVIKSKMRQQYKGSNKNNFEFFALPTLSSILPSRSNTPIQNEVYNALQITYNFVDKLRKAGDSDPKKKAALEEEYRLHKGELIAITQRYKTVDWGITSDQINNDFFSEKLTHTSALGSPALPKSRVKQLRQAANHSGANRVSALEAINQFTEVQTLVMDVKKQLIDFHKYKSEYLSLLFEEAAKGITLSCKSRLKSFLGIEKNTAKEVVVAVYDSKVNKEDALIQQMAQKAILYLVFRDAMKSKEYKRPPWVAYRFRENESLLIKNIRMNTFILNNAVCADLQAHWGEIVGNIICDTDVNNPEPTPGFGAEVLKTLISGIGVANMLDQNVWDQTQEGGILFSPKKDSTLCFTNNGLSRYDEAFKSERGEEVRQLLNKPQ